MGHHGARTVLAPFCRKEFFMSLFKNSKIFVDVKNCVVSYDAIVASRLDEYFSSNEGSKYFFIKDIDKFKGQQLQALSQLIMEEKNNYNFLLDFFDWSKLTGDFEDTDPTKLCDYIYQEALNMEDKDNELYCMIGSGQLMTKIGQSFKLLLEDDKLVCIYFYVEKGTPDYILHGLDFFYMNKIKTKYITGDKATIFKENPMDSYFVETSEEIDMLSFERPFKIDVQIAGSKYNTSAIEKFEGVDLKTLSTLEPVSVLEGNKYNMSIYTMLLPI